jgi:hypothetical protein
VAHVWDRTLTPTITTSFLGDWSGVQVAKDGTATSTQKVEGGDGPDRFPNLSGSCLTDANSCDKVVGHGRPGKNLGTFCGRSSLLRWPGTSGASSVEMRRMPHGQERFISTPAPSRRKARSCNSAQMRELDLKLISRIAFRLWRRFRVWFGRPTLNRRLPFLSGTFPYEGRQEWR